MGMSVCFTGHRWLGPGVSEEWAIDTLNDAVRRSVESGANWLTSGGAPGFDCRFLEAAMVERWRAAGKPVSTGKGMFDVHTFPDKPETGIVVCAALPFPDFWDYYKDKGRESWNYFEALRGQMDIILHISPTPGYGPDKMHKRNRWIVDGHDVLVAVYDGRKSGGTYETLKYARKSGKKILWINPTDETERWV